ncbi:Hypothetical predicted protein, partial [Drosophila guanche]
VIAGSIVAPGFPGALGHSSRSHNTRGGGYGSTFSSSSFAAGYHRGHATASSPMPTAATTTSTVPPLSQSSATATPTPTPTGSAATPATAPTGTTFNPAELEHLSGGNLTN